MILVDEKNFAEAQSVLEESRALYEEVHDGWGVAHAYTCHAALSESAFTTAVEEGRVMTMEQAIAYALEE